MTLRSLLALAYPYRWVLLAGSLLLLVQNAVALLVPWVAGRFAASVLAPGGMARALLLPLLALLTLDALLKFVAAVSLSRVSATLTVDLKHRVAAHVLRLPTGYFDEGRRGDLLALLTWETEQLCGFLAGTLLSLLPQLVAVIGAVLAMLALDVRLALVVSACVPLFYLVLKMVGRGLRPLALQVQQLQAQAFATLEEQLESIMLIKVFGREPAETARHRVQLEAIAQLQRRQGVINALLEPLLYWLAAAAVLLLLALGGTRSQAGELDTAALVSFMLYAALLTRPVAALAGVYGQVQAARGSFARLRALMQEPIEAQGGAVLPAVRGELRFEAVRFAYPGRAPVLDGVTLTVAAGDTVAIVGANGCGKTTLVKLLLRLHEPASGAIALDGHDIATLDLRFLREQFSVVSQQVLLVNDSVAANIAYGVQGATRADIERVAVLAQADDFIRQLPQGYDTLVGDQGQRLSGGQRQRLALARALLRKAPVLVLDEATAMFDPVGEAGMLAACRAHLASATVILITHRPAALALADRVLRLEHGRLHDVPAAADPRLP